MERRIGERVRMVHRPESTGVIAGPVEPSALDGTPRYPVRWDRTGNITRWNPEFLIAITQPVDQDPPVVTGRSLRSIAASVQLLGDGMVMVCPARFEQVSGAQAPTEPPAAPHV